MLSVIFITNNTVAQVKSEKKEKKIPKIIITSSSQLYSGMLLSIEDSIITIVEKQSTGDLVYQFHYSELEKIEVLKRGKFGKGFLKSFLYTTAGNAALTGLIFLTAQDEYMISPLFVFAVMEVYMLPVHFVVGLITHRYKRNFDGNMNGYYSAFNKLKENLKYSKVYTSDKENIIMKTATPMK